MISKASNGTYKIDRVEVTDHAGNETEYSYADLVNLGFSTEFEIVGAQAADTTAPRTLSDLSAYLTEGFWSDQSTYYRKWNLSDTGINAKSGEITYSLGSNWYDEDGINSNHSILTRYAFQYLENITGINFIETSDGSSADFAFGNENSGAFAAWDLANFAGGNQVYLDTAYLNIEPNWYSSSPTENDYVYQTILHEIGHVLGLGHQGDYNGSASFPTDADFDNDCWSNSIMSYFNQGDNTNIDADDAFLQTFMAVDFLALEALYGDQSYGGTIFGTSNAFVGNTTYGFNTTILASDDYVMSRLAENGDENAFCIVDGAGNDTLDCSGWSADQLINLTITSSSDTAPTTSNIAGLTGNLSLAANTVIENAKGGSGSDIIIGNQYGNYLKGNAGNDTLRAAGGNDNLQGGNNNDKLYGGSGNDKSYGQAGNDSLYMDAGNDTLDGGSGTDWLYVTGSANSVVNLAKTTSQNTGYGTDIIKNIEHASGGTGVDKLYGTTGNNILKGNNGNDILQGKNGNDNLQGGNNNDKLYGGSGNDKSYGQAGNDSLYMDAGNDTLDGGSGNDWLYVTGSANSVVNLAKTTGQNTGYGTDIIKNIENASGGKGVDKFYGTAGNNTLKGNNGNDILQGKNGNDNLQGGNNNDKLYGGNNNDKLYGGNGNDKSYGQAGNDSLYMDAGNDKLDGGSGTDWLYVTGSANSVVNLAKTTSQNTGYGTDIIKNIEHASGGTGVDKLYGTTGNNILKGNSGNDNLQGKNGNDKLYGGNNNDKLYGGNGNDLIKGDKGRDALDGGDGRDYMYAGNDTDRDVFIFRDTDESVKGSQRDRIYQFDSGEDDIHLRLIDANEDVAGHQNFIFSSDGAAANSVWAQDSGSNVLVRGDVNGDLIHDFEIFVASVDDLYVYDFIL